MKLRKNLLALLLLGLTLIPRLASLRSFVTIDEPFWLSVGANYYYALGQREFQNTVYEYHPAVTTMSFVTAAFLVDFPDYRGYGQGYFDVDKEKFDPFLIEHGHDPMYLLYLSRLFQVGVITLFVLIIFYFLSVLIGEEKAFLVTALTASAPYFLGHSRVLSHEAMVAAFVLASIVSLMAYLEHERKWYYLLISAASAALAQVTKSSAMAMFPAIALILAVSVFEKAKAQGFKPALFDHLKIFGIWLVELVGVYIVVWPGMWVAPGKMLYEVYGNAFSYAFEGARLQVTQELQPSKFSLGSVWSTALGFIRTIILKATPVSWLGVVLAGGFLFSREKNSFVVVFKKLVLYLFVTAVMFILLFSIAQGRNSAHYIMSSYVSMDAIVALGWCALLGWLGTKWEKANQLQVWAGAALIFFQLMSAISFYPYYYTYGNPIIAMITGQEAVSDYGEGFEQAALYLSQKPNAASLKVLSFRGRGPFSYFFPGQTIILNPLFIEEPNMGSMRERLAQADYLVINAALGPRTERTKLFVSGLDGVVPEDVINIKGVSTIYIYKISDLPPSFYENMSK
ncbi:MAG: glycosyltransferase family 39 protein [Anaerolineales bacterium]